MDVPGDLRTVDSLDLFEALDELRDCDERLARVVECKFFCGLTIPDVAELLGVSEKIIEKDWTFAKAWWAQRLGGGDDTRTVPASP